MSKLTEDLRKLALYVSVTACTFFGVGCRDQAKQGAAPPETATPTPAAQVVPTATLVDVGSPVTAVPLPRYFKGEKVVDSNDPQVWVNTMKGLNSRIEVFVAQTSGNPNIDKDQLREDFSEALSEVAEMFPDNAQDANTMEPFKAPAIAKAVLGLREIYAGQTGTLRGLDDGLSGQENIVYEMVSSTNAVNLFQNDAYVELMRGHSH